LRGYGVEISFKRWAKLEASSTAAVYPVPKVLRWERALEACAPPVVFAGKALRHMTGDRRWSELAYLMRKRLVGRVGRMRANRPRADAFLLEVYNPEPSSVRLQVMFSAAAKDRWLPDRRTPRHAFVSRTVTLPEGYSRHRIDYTEFAPLLESEGAMRISIVPEGDSRPTLVFLTADLVRSCMADRSTQRAQPIKCLVWDLDDTLWHGVLAEGDATPLHAKALDILSTLDRRGILNSIASKNDRAAALDRLHALGVADYFVCPQIDWAPKSQKLRTIAERLNLGTDAFAFIDDNPFELDEVRRACPEVLCLNARDINSIIDHPRFQGSATPEAQQRRRLYQEQAVRDDAQHSFGGDYIGFVASCAIKLEIGPYAPDDSDRVTELVQRTNQLNFSGRKYTRAQLAEALANPALEKYVIRCTDRFGSYGTVGFCLVAMSDRAIEIVDFMLSCRVQSRFIETALFDHIARYHNPARAERMLIKFHQTERNAPAHGVLERLGFRLCDPAIDGYKHGLILRSLDNLSCDFISVTCRCAQCSQAATMPSLATS
jgi:FkbH-like protein